MALYNPLVSGLFKGFNLMNPNNGTYYAGGTPGFNEGTGLPSPTNPALLQRNPLMGSGNMFAGGTPGFNESTGQFDPAGTLSGGTMYAGGTPGFNGTTGLPNAPAQLNGPTNPLASFGLPNYPLSEGQNFRMYDESGNSPNLNATYRGGQFYDQSGTPIDLTGARLGKGNASGGTVLNLGNGGMLDLRTPQQRAVDAENYYSTTRPTGVDKVAQGITFGILGLAGGGALGALGDAGGEAGAAAGGIGDTGGLAATAPEGGSAFGGFGGDVAPAALQYGADGSVIFPSGGGDIASGALEGGGAAGGAGGVPSILPKLGLGALSGLGGGGPTASAGGTPGFDESGQTSGSGLGDLLNLIGGLSPAVLAGYLGNQQRQGISGQVGLINNTAGSLNAPAFMGAITNPYDLQTGLGRTALTNSLQQRGVGGSSFGNQQLANYDYTRGLGRGDLATRAGTQVAATQGALYNEALKGMLQNNQTYNKLLGAGLGASGSLLNRGPGFGSLLSGLGGLGSSLYN